MIISPLSISCYAKPSMAECVECRANAIAVFRTGSWSKPVCRDHADRFCKLEPDHWTKLSGCVNCGLTVYLARTVGPGMMGAERYAQWITRPVCSHSCNLQARLAERKAARLQARSGRKCAVCNKPFIAKRSDQKTCSNRCRQALHRRSKPSTAHRPISPPW
jgi:hypothetical protein